MREVFEANILYLIWVVICDVYICQNSLKYPIKMMHLLYVNYTSIKVFLFFCFNLGLLTQISQLLPSTQATPDNTVTDMCPCGWQELLVILTPSACQNPIWA